MFASRFGQTCIAFASVVIALPAAAQSRDPAAAEALYKEGRDLLSKNDWPAACAKFEASMSLDPVASTQLNIAKCREHEGKLARAWADYKRALVLNQETAGAERRKSLEEIATKAVAALEPRLPKLKIVVRDPPAELRVTRDGQELPASVLGQSIVVDPGSHTVVASAPGRRTEQRTIVAQEGKSEEVELVLSSEGGAEPALSAGPAAVPPPPTTDPGPGSNDAPSTGGVPTWAWIAGGAGLVFAGVAVGFRIDGAAADQELEDACGTELVCDPASGFDPEPLNARKNRDFGLFIGFGAASVLALGAAVVGIVTAPSSKPAATASARGVSPWLTPHEGGLAWRGVF